MSVIHVAKVYGPKGSFHPMVLHKRDIVTGHIVTSPMHAWELGTTRWIESHIGKGDIFLDVGAHVGYYTVLASKIVGPNGWVYAFEPSSVNFPLLARNVKLNDCLNVILFNVAVSDKTEKTKLYPSSDRGNLGGFHMKGEGEEYEEVETVRLDDVVEGCPKMVKIDVEGAERLVLAGMSRILKECGRGLHIVMECFSRTTANILVDKGFALMIVHDGWNYCLKGLSKKEQQRMEQWRNFCQKNITEGRPWYYGLKGEWWWGMTMEDFLGDVAERGDNRC